MVGGKRLVTCGAVFHFNSSDTPMRGLSSEVPLLIRVRVARNFFHLYRVVIDRLASQARSESLTSASSQLTIAQCSHPTV